MPVKNQEFYVVVLIGIVLALLLVGFIVTIFFLYQRKRLLQEQEMDKMKVEYEQELLRSQLEIQESTLKGIAQELHDNIGQVLSVIKLWMASMPLEKDHAAYEGLQDSRKLLNQVILDMANLTKSLHTDRITQIGLAEAIRFDVEMLKKTGVLQINFSLTGNEISFDGQKSIFLFRIFQEMINNILKHAKATLVNVSIIYSADNKFVLRVQDNGIGFDLGKKRTEVNSSSGLGLKSMMNRAQLIGAEVSMESEPGKGTDIKVELPMDD